MVVVRLFGFLLLFMTITWRISIIPSLQDINIESGLESSSTDTVYSPQLSFKTAAQRMEQGRQIMNKNIVMKMRGVNAKFGSFVASKISNAATWERAETGFQYVEKRKNGRKIMSEDDDVSGFVAFNADYRGPMRHPPKNN